jgi:D-glycero-alpha-D-manno-heptose 1-phosphate guanylyltransferase
MHKSKKIVEAIILAGGLGTRLRSEIGELPKPLAPTGGVPFLQILLNYLHSNGIERVILAVGYKWELIEAVFGSRYKEMDLIYSVEDKALGTGGALKLALEKTNEGQIFVLNGDTLFTIPLVDLSASHTRKKSDCSIALHYIAHNTRYGNVLIDGDQRIRNFSEKGEAAAGYINGGIYLLQKAALDTFKTGDVFSFEIDFLTKKTSNLNLYGQVFNAYFKDIGIPEDYHQFERDLTQEPLKHLH